jgi:hypothetical protein
VFTNTGATIQDNDPIYDSFDEGEPVGEALAREVGGTPEYVVCVSESHPRHEPELWATSWVEVASRAEDIRQQISMRAYEIWEKNGRPLGNDPFADWLEAKKQLGCLIVVPKTPIEILQTGLK